MKNIDELIHIKWVEDVNNKPKLRTYVTYKKNVGVEPYITQFLSRKPVHSWLSLD